MRRILLILFAVGAIMTPWLMAVQPAYAVSDGADFVVQTIPGPTVGEKIFNRAKSSWPWYLTRASGFVAAILLVVLMLSGIGQVTGYTFRILDPLTSWASHRVLGITFSIALLLHIFSLLFDHFVKFSLLELLIPWLSDYRPVKIFGASFGSLYVALGVLAFYLTALIMFSSLVWVEKKPHLWKWLHLLSYMTMVFVFVHALYIGSDLTHGIWRIIWIVFAGVVFVATLQRLWRVKTT